jgi:predicted permease
MGIPLRLGRDFSWQDGENTPKVAVINESMAHYYFSNANPIGKRFGWGETKNSTEIEIVGVAKDAKYDSLREQTPHMIYFPFLQNAKYLWVLAVHTVGKPSDVAAAIRQEVKSVDPSLPVTNVATLAEQVDESLRPERLIAKLSGLFGLLGLLLAAVGLYGTMSYTVARRTNEIGIRMALGAQRGDVLWSVLKESLQLVMIGVVIGLPAALSATRLISSQLFGLTPNDPGTIAMATLLLVAVAAIAGYLPARKASRVDPMVALRYE